MQNGFRGLGRIRIDSLSASSSPYSTAARREDIRISAERVAMASVPIMPLAMITGVAIRRSPGNGGSRPKLSWKGDQPKRRHMRIGANRWALRALCSNIVHWEAQ